MKIAMRTSLALMILVLLYKAYGAAEPVLLPHTSAAFGALFSDPAATFPGKLAVGALMVFSTAAAFALGVLVKGFLAVTGALRLIPPRPSRR